MTGPTIATMTYLMYDVNHAIENAKFGVGFHEMRAIVESGRLFEFFEKHGDQFDVSIITEDERDYVSKNLAEIAGGLHGREPGKIGIEKNGLCLLMAYLIELVDLGAAKYHSTFDCRDKGTP